MLTKNKNPKINYFSRLLVLPLAAIVFFAFTLRMKTPGAKQPYTGKTITVIIDAGHGGEDGGAKSDNGIFEKDLTLHIAKKIKELNSNKNVKIVLLRDKDETIPVKQRVEIAKTLKADLFISIHIDLSTDNAANSGLSILVANDNPYLEKSKLLGFSINESFKNNYQLPVSAELRQREKGIWVLNANQCPAVLVQTGFIDNPNDLKFLMNAQNQEIIAKNILNGIERYATKNLQAGHNISVNQDTIFTFKGQTLIDTKSRISLTADTIIYTTEPDKTRFNILQSIVIVNGKIENNNILRTKTIAARQLIIHSGDEENILSKYGEAAKNGVIVFENAVIIDKPPYYPEESGISKYINGNNEEKDKENEKRIDYINDTIPKFHKGKKIKEAQVSNKLNKALILYEDGSKDTLSINEGEKLRIIPPPPPPPDAAKKNMINNAPDLTLLENDSIHKKLDKIFTKVEVDPSFPGGEQARAKYMTNALEQNLEELTKENQSGTCCLRFIVGLDGSISEVTALTMQGSKLAEVAIHAIKNGPKWIPAKQNDHLVVAYKELPVTFTIQQDKIFTKVEK